MKKQDYIDAVNEIKADEKLKKQTMQKIIENKKTHSKTIYSLATAMVVFAITISITIPMVNNKNTVTPIQVVEESNGLPKIENFENLYNMLKNVEEEYNGVMKDTTLNSVDSVAISSATTEKLESNVVDSSLREHSTTNVQVDGVDEADIVKTDGNYIYYILENKIVLIDARNEEKLKVVSEINYENEYFYPREMFLSNNKIAVIGTTNLDYYYYRYTTVDIAYPTDDYTVAKIYDVTNKSKPILQREISLEGSYLSSRMIGENIYFIANKYIYSYLCNRYDRGEITQESFKPRYMDTAISNKERYIDFCDIYYIPESEDRSYLNIAGFNINNNEPANIETYMGAGQNIYSSENNLYITKTKYDYKNVTTDGYYKNFDINTYIYKFKLDNSKIKYVNIGSVPGEIINQFAMDEKDNFLRIATTNRENWNSSSNKNNVYVLDENLKIVGQIENLAKGEKIYSVRFMQNRVYMVTFVQTDPLFVIDLSEPTNPIVLGELKIPGYSKYLHPYDENHLIGIGENTTTNQYGGVVTEGMKMALFDVTNPNDPKQLYSVNIGDQGTYSSILNNHKSLLFSKEKNIIAFPISISQKESNIRSDLTFQGAIVYGLDLESGFNLKGKIAHMEINDGYEDYEYKKEVERIIYINENLYTLSKEIVKSTNMNTMEEIYKLDI